MPDIEDLRRETINPVISLDTSSDSFKREPYCSSDKCETSYAVCNWLRTSPALPFATPKNTRNSLLLPRSNPSAILEPMLTAALLI